MTIASDPDSVKLSNGITLSSVGVGTWAWGDRRVWGMNGYDSSYNFSTIEEAYRSSIDAGATLFDTAEVYGNGESERILGKLLAANASYKDKAVIATKFFPAPWKWFVKSALLKALHGSLSRLGLPYTHLYQIHGPISLRSHEAMADALYEAYRAGLTKAVGVSNYSEKEVRAIHKALKDRGVPLATNQIEFSLLRTKPEKVGLLRACKELNITILAYSPIGQGRLSGKYSKQNPPPGNRGFSNYPMEELESLIDQLRTLGQKYGEKTPSQVALNWIIRKGAIPIPGAKNKNQALQNAGAMGWALSEEDVTALSSLGKFDQGGMASKFWQHG